MLELTVDERNLLEGGSGEGAALAMRVVTRVAKVMGANRLRPIVGAHIDSCLYHGPATLDFADRLVDGGARVSVPTTLNVSSLDLIHPDLYRGDPEVGAAARRLMDRYEEMGCRPTWTCAPYQLADRPGYGEHVAWAESNAIVFANSVLGARTHRYGDFVDIAAAITGLVPDAGLHTDRARRARHVFDLTELDPGVFDGDAAYAVLGFHVGRHTGSRIPALVGLPPDTTEDQLKAFGAAAASSGSVAMFHAIGRTPEAPTLEAALGDVRPELMSTVTATDLRDGYERLSTATGPLAVVSLGTPHYSAAQIAHVDRLLGGRRVHPGVRMYVSTGRDVLAEAGEAVASLGRAGVQLVTDTCTYITPIIEGADGVAMTDSAKWAYYAPGNLGLDVVFAAVGDCVESAVEGRVVTRGWLGV